MLKRDLYAKGVYGARGPCDNSQSDVCMEALRQFGRVGVFGDVFTDSKGYVFGR